MLFLKIIAIACFAVSVSCILGSIATIGEVIEESAVHPVSAVRPIIAACLYLANLIHAYRLVADKFKFSMLICLGNLCMFLFLLTLCIYLFFVGSPTPRNPATIVLLAYFLANAVIYPLAKKINAASTLDLDKIFD